MNPPRCKTKRRLNALSVAQMMVAMQDEAHTVHELRELVGLSLYTTRHYVLTLHREGGCHIAHWEQDGRGRYTTPAYRLGKRRDAVRPVICNKARSKAYRARKAQQAMLYALAA
jgi:hypothetical protein